MKHALALAILGTVFGVSAQATENLREEILDLRSKVSHLESARMAAGAEEEGNTLTSMRKTGQIQIGGSVEVDIVVVEGESWRDTQNNLNDNDEATHTYFGTGLPYDTAGAYLDFQIHASADTFLTIKLDLDDFWNTTVDQDDLLEEIYFTWEGVRCSNFDVIFGRKTVDYGTNKFNGITPSFHTGYALGFMGNWTNRAADTPAFDSTGTNSFPLAPADTFQIETIYHHKDLFKVYATVFQDPGARGMHEDRSDDSLFFESWALKVEWMPMENLVLQASVVNQHNESNGEGTDENEDNQMAISLGADYTFKCLPLNLWGEYQHGYDWGYLEDVDLDVYSVGASYGLTESIDLGLLAEYATISHTNPATVGNLNMEDEAYYQAVLTGTYNFENGLFMTVEYARQWYQADLQDNNDQDRDAELFGFRTGFSF